MFRHAKVRGVGEEGVSQSSASLRLIELRLEAWQQAAILSDTGGNVNDVNDATGARVFQNKLINCLVAPTNFTTHPGPEVRPHMVRLGVKVQSCFGELARLALFSPVVCTMYSVCNHLGTEQLNLNKPSTSVSFLAHILPRPPLLLP